MLFYYFTKAHHAIDNIKRKRIKISDFSSLNDPFELLGVDLRDSEVRKIMKRKKAAIARKKGLVCFSEDKYNPVQWAHYADSNKGVCLGFEIPERELIRVKYVPARLDESVLSDPKIDEMLLTTKFRHWKYEKERRLLIDLKGIPKDSKGNRFLNFGSNIILREIYIGCEASLTYEEIKSKVGPHSRQVIAKHTRPSFKDFRIVWNQSKKSLRF